MNITKTPFCSVVVLNYYGEKVIESTIRSLMKMDYPKDCFNVVIVDNNSQDKSRGIIDSLKNQFKNIETIFLDKNLGFAKGNNIGIKHSKGKYVALLNNDCIVDKRWLGELVATAERNPNVFAVGSKTLLYPKYVPLQVKLESKQLLESCFLSESHLRVFTKKNIEISVLEKGEYYMLDLPYDPEKDSIIVVSLLVNQKGFNRQKAFELEILGFGKKHYQIKKRVRNSDIVYEVRINLKDKYVAKSSYDRIQNAGIVVFQDGFGRDIGTVVRDHAQYYEKDDGQFDKEREIYAACGVAVLLKADVLKKIGYLDESFFMYYEDDEISERARIKGYKIFYSPGAVVRHIHALSSGEWSAFFIYHTNKGRLLHIFYMFPFRIFLFEYLKMLCFILGNFTIFLSRFSSLLCYFQKKGPEKKLQNLNVMVQYFKVAAFFVVYLPSLFFKKFRKGLSPEKIENNYQSILTGRWYFEQE